ncbi:conserved hypothetical protein [Flavobacterium sp. 9AF]|uniref:hypothetical protein n=1 Tax=Flavobacterium sp. 9AF TaxID=2653142 RepID=UPI0012F2EB1E|nr:hypothetical protein [Flavobacterium sp. 9AF]VXC24666.1 conserved hypothetical protein [Flavobacterium sp. 9AF]
MKKKIFIAILPFLLFSCNDKKDNSLKQEEIIVNDTLVQKDTLVENNSSEFLDLFSKRKQEIILKLEKLTNEEADKLYEEYFEENQSILNKINENESNLLENFYSEDENAIKVKNLIDKLDEHDLRIEELGEGYVEISPKPDFYYKIFKNQVSDDYKSYLYIISEENKELYSADAGLAISFKDLGDRIIAWENFMSQFPNSTLLQSVKEVYKSYQWDYLLGLDNTPTTEKYSDKEDIYIYEENLNEFNRFLKEYPNSPTSQLVKWYLENFKGENIVDKIRAMQEQN